MSYVNLGFDLDEYSPPCPLGGISSLCARVWSPDVAPFLSPPAFVTVSIHFTRPNAGFPCHYNAQYYFEPVNDNWLIERTIEEEDDGA